MLKDLNYLSIVGFENIYKECTKKIFYRKSVTLSRAQLHHQCSSKTKCQRKFIREILRDKSRGNVGEHKLCLLQLQPKDLKWAEKQPVKSSTSQSFFKNSEILFFLLRNVKWWHLPAANIIFCFVLFVSVDQNQQDTLMVSCLLISLFLQKLRKCFCRSCWGNLDLLELVDRERTSRSQSQRYLVVIRISSGTYGGTRLCNVWSSFS